MALEGVDDAALAVCFAEPASPFGVGVESVDVGELVLEGRHELGCWVEVVARFADVGVEASAGGEVDARATRAPGPRGQQAEEFLVCDPLPGGRDCKVTNSRVSPRRSS